MQHIQRNCFSVLSSSSKTSSTKTAKRLIPHSTCLLSASTHHQKVEYVKEEPLVDYTFDSESFSGPAMHLVTHIVEKSKNQSDSQRIIERQILEKTNQERLSTLKRIATSDKDPFELVKDDLKYSLHFAINNILQTRYTELEKAAHYNLLLKGKNFRSAILFLLAKSIYYGSENQKAGSVGVVIPFEDTIYYDKVACLAACIEIAHNASLLQDDIIDHADSRRSSKAAHKVFGKATSIFTSDFMIARASRMLTEAFPESVHLSQLYSTVLCNLVYGELIQAKRDLGTAKKISLEDGLENFEPTWNDFDSQAYFSSYIEKTYYKTASMISLGCRGISILMQLKEDSHQRALFDFGAHLGIAFQIHDDILDFTQSEAQLGKPAFNDLKEGIVTAPIIYALLEQSAQDKTSGVRWEQSTTQGWLEAVERKF